MEPNPNEKLYYPSTNRDRENSYRFKSPENKSIQGLSFVGHKSTKSGLDMVSPTYQNSRKEFTSTLRQGNKSSSKLRMRSANSISINSANNIHDNNDLKFNSNLKLSQSREKSKVMSSYGDNSKF
jgi:hypothetical protein